MMLQKPIEMGEEVFFVLLSFVYWELGCMFPDLLLNLNFCYNFTLHVVL